jgi:hypothetical protein
MEILSRQNTLEMQRDSINDESNITKDGKIFSAKEISFSVQTQLRVIKRKLLLTNLRIMFSD